MLGSTYRLLVLFTTQFSACLAPGDAYMLDPPGL